MRYIFLCVFIICYLHSEGMMEEQIKWNIDKALEMHKEFLDKFYKDCAQEYEKLNSQIKGDEKSKIETIYTEMCNQIDTICKEKKTARDEIVEKESKQYIETFKEIKAQGTPEKILDQRATSLGHNIFHIMQKDHEMERNDIMNVYLNNVEQMMREAEIANIASIIKDKKDTFTLEENIKRETHNITHTFQILNEFEFTDQQKNWILDRLYTQVAKAEKEKSHKKSKFWKIIDSYLETQAEEMKKQDLTEEEITQKLDKTSKAKIAIEKMRMEFAERLAKYEKNLEIYSQRRMSNLQREIYYFKGFIDGEISRYKSTQFPESIIHKLENRHWQIFLEMTDTNLKRWSEEDTILFTRHLISELSLCNYDSKKIEECLLTYFF